VQAGVSEHERLSIMERMLGGRIAQPREGKPWCGKFPIGRAWDGQRWLLSDRGRALAPLLQRYVEGESLTELAPEYGFSSAQLIMRYVRDGQLSAHPYVVEFNTPEIGIEQVKVEVPAIPAVISPQLVRDRLNHNRTWNKQCLRKYLLSGFLRCAHCGQALTSRTRNGLSYYRHRAHRNGGNRQAKGAHIGKQKGPTRVQGYTWSDRLGALGP
jgi:hypothetical protein